MKKYILAHDLGTSGNKATLFSEDGQLIGSVVISYETDYFNEVWAEQDANDWWQAVCQSSNGLLKRFDIAPDAIEVISFSGQMMGCLCVDKEGTPLRKSIIWADQRAQEQAKQIEQHISQEAYYQIVGHKNTASYGIHKLMWVRDNEPDIYEKTYKTLNAKDYIVFKLTGGFYTDYSDGNSNGCFDLEGLEWSEELIGYAGIDRDKLPELKPSTFVAGGVTEEASKATGLAVGTKVVIGAGDGVTANIGAGSISPGKTYCCMGTSAWVTTTTDKPVFDDKMRTVTWAHAVPGLYAPNGTMQSAGGAYSWVKNEICKLETYKADKNDRSPYEYMNEEIKESSIGSNGVWFLPYLMGERAPRWNPDARGAYIGLKSENKRGDILRSTLEGVTMNLAIILDILREHIEINEMMVVGGGAKGEIWRRIMADCFNTKIKVPSLLEEAGSMGAAVIGGVGAGLYSEFSVIDQFIDIVSEELPVAESAEKYKHMREIFDECYYALEQVFDKMN